MNLDEGYNCTALHTFMTQQVLDVPSGLHWVIPPVLLLLTSTVELPAVHGGKENYL